MDQHPSSPENEKIVNAVREQLAPAFERLSFEVAPASEYRPDDDPRNPESADE